MWWKNCRHTILIDFSSSFNLLVKGMTHEKFSCIKPHIFKTLELTLLKPLQKHEAHEKSMCMQPYIFKTLQTYFKMFDGYI